MARVHAARFPKNEICLREIGPSLLTDTVDTRPGHGFVLMPPEFANLLA